MKAKSVNPSVADAHQPDLGIGMMSEQLVGCRDRVIGYFECCRIDINGDDFAVVAGFNQWPNPLL